MIRPNVLGEHTIYQKFFISIFYGHCLQWRSRGGDGSGPSRAAKLRVYLKIWKGEKYFVGEKFLGMGFKRAVDE